MAKEIIKEPARSLKEYRVLPGLTTEDNIPSKVSLRTKLCALPETNDYIYANICMMGAAMQAVTNEKTGVALPQFGSVAVIPLSFPLPYVMKIFNAVKRAKSGLQPEPVTFSPEHTIADVVETMNKQKYSTFPITHDGTVHGKLVGVLTDLNFDSKDHLEDKIGVHMRTDYGFALEGCLLEDANKLLVKYGTKILPIVDKEGYLRYTAFKKDLEKHRSFPDELVDKEKRYMVAAAVPTKNYKERVQELVRAGVDILVVDSSDGRSTFQVETFNYIRNLASHIPVIGGNVVDEEGFEHLYSAGFDAAKVGIGIGSGCTTQEMTGIGEAQGSAISDVCKARDALWKKHGKYLPVIGDGSIANPGTVVNGIALGADMIMAGRFFGQYTESPGKLIKHKEYGWVKEWWMEASEKALQMGSEMGRYDLTIPELWSPEGIEGFVPHIGSIYEYFPKTLQKIKEGFSHAGCKNVEEMHSNSRVRLQSEVALMDAGIHDMIPK